MTVRDRVTREIRNRILFGALSAGDRLDLDALATEFGTSRTPVREACLELANDNLVNVAPRSGVTVVGITTSDLLDNFELMATLAGMAAAWAAERATEEDQDRIHRACEAVATASALGGDVSTQNLEFHRSVNRASHSRRLSSMIGQAARLFPDRFSDVVAAQVACSLPEHAAIVAAISDHDPSRARRLMEAHFHDALSRLRRHLSSPDSATDHVAGALVEADRR